MVLGESKPAWGTKQIVITGLGFLMVVAGGAYIMISSSSSLGRAGEKIEGEDEKFRLVTPEIDGTMEGVVGSDIGRGRYRSDNSNPNCEWFSMQIGEDTRSGKGKGTFEVDLAADLMIFRTTDCDTWRLITEP